MEDLQVQLQQDDRRKRWVNGLCVAVGQSFSLPVAFSLGYESPWGWFFLLAWALATFSLYTRFSHPVRMTVLVIAGVALTVAAPNPYLAIWWPVPLVVYHWARYGQRRVRLLALGGSAAAAFVGGFVFLGMFEVYGWGTVELVAMYVFATFMCFALVVIAWFFGDSRRLRENQHRALIERNRQLLHEREQERALAALDERARIAREMHDIVAHSLSTIIAQADGARYAALAAQAAKGQDDAAQLPAAQPAALGSAAGSGGVRPGAQAPAEPVEITALSTISQAARSSLEQMRALLGVLRTDEGMTVEPLPALHNVAQLVASSQKLGLPIRFTAVSGVEERLPQGAELTVYRIVQEALTNITKHCPHTPLVTLTISEAKNGLEIDIINRPQAHQSAPLPGARRGLLGMRERVDMYAGTLHYGHLPDGSFRVFARIPFAQ